MTVQNTKHLHAYLIEGYGGRSIFYAHGKKEAIELYKRFIRATTLPAKRPWWFDDSSIPFEAHETIKVKPKKEVNPFYLTEEGFQKQLKILERIEDHYCLNGVK